MIPTYGGVLSAIKKALRELVVINFRIYYLRNFIFGFPVNYDWSRDRLYSLGESVGHGGFKHRHMEDWVNRAHRLWKMESE